MNARKLFNSFVSIVLPSSCTSCNRALSVYPLPICHSCSRVLLDLTPKPVITYTKRCKVTSCTKYEKLMKTCVKSLKYGGNRNLLPLFNNIIASFSLREKIDLIIPVPIHSSKLRERGYNQSELISSLLAEKLSLPVSTHTVTRTRRTSQQTGLSKKERMENLKGSFIVVDRLGVMGKSVLVVDDILTTGATMNECSKVLLEAGAKHVSGFTLAKTIL